MERKDKEKGKRAKYVKLGRLILLMWQPVFLPLLCECKSLPLTN